MKKYEHKIIFNGDNLIEMINFCNKGLFSPWGGNMETLVSETCGDFTIHFGEDACIESLEIKSFIEYKSLVEVRKGDTLVYSEVSRYLSVIKRNDAEYFLSY